jgi:hypothetical protein
MHRCLVDVVCMGHEGMVIDEGLSAKEEKVVGDYG